MLAAMEQLDLIGTKARSSNSASKPFEFVIDDWRMRDCQPGLD
jgi:rubredoxin